MDRIHEPALIEDGLSVIIQLANLDNGCQVSIPTNFCQSYSLMICCNIFITEFVKIIDVDRKEGLP